MNQINISNWNIKLVKDINFWNSLFVLLDKPIESKNTKITSHTQILTEFNRVNLSVLDKLFNSNLIIFSDWLLTISNQTYVRWNQQKYSYYQDKFIRNERIYQNFFSNYITSQINISDTELLDSAENFNYLISQDIIQQTENDNISRNNSMIDIDFLLSLVNNSTENVFTLVPFEKHIIMLGSAEIIDEKLTAEYSDQKKYNITSLNYIYKKQLYKFIIIKLN